MGIASPEISDCLWSRTGGRGLELWRRWEGQFQLRSKYREKTGFVSWARNASSLLSLLIHSFGNKGIVTLVRVWHIASLRLLFSSVKQSLFQGWCDVYAHKWCLGVLFCNSKLKCTGVVKTNCYCLNLASLPKFMLRLKFTTRQYWKVCLWGGDWVMKARLLGMGTGALWKSLTEGVQSSTPVKT